MTFSLVVHANDPLALVVGDSKDGPTYHQAAGAVYVGRANTRANNPIAHRDSPFRNPWSIAQVIREGTPEAHAREDVLGRHIAWLDGDIEDFPELRVYVLAHLHELRGHPLVCWCATSGRPLRAWDPLVCHGQTLSIRAGGS